jgi:hypothetical protein
MIYLDGFRLRCHRLPLALGFTLYCFYPAVYALYIPMVSDFQLDRTNLSERSMPAFLLSKELTDGGKSVECLS